MLHQNLNIETIFVIVLPLLVLLIFIIMLSAAFVSIRSEERASNDSTVETKTNDQL